MDGVHLTGSPHAVGVDDDHRVCDAIAARPDAETMHDWVSRFALLADPTRLTLLLCIHRVGEICVTDLALAAGLKDTTCSQALRLLRAQGLVSAHREGRVVRYRLADDAVHDLLHHLLGRVTQTDGAPAPLGPPAARGTAGDA